MLFKSLPPVALACLAVPFSLHAQQAAPDWVDIQPTGAEFTLQAPATWLLSEEELQNGVVFLYAPPDGPSDAFRESFSVQWQGYSAAERTALEQAALAAQQQNTAFRTMPLAWVISHLLATDFTQRELATLPGYELLEKSFFHRGGAVVHTRRIRYTEQGSSRVACYGLVYLKGQLYVFTELAVPTSPTHYTATFQGIWRRLVLLQ